MRKELIRPKKKYRIETYELKYLLLIALSVLLLASQLYMFVKKGTVLGYQVRSVESQNSKNVSKTTPAACKKVTAEKASQILGLPVEAMTETAEDRTEPNLVSSCFYRTSQTPSRSVSILLREVENEEIAKTVIAKAVSKDANRLESAPANIADEVFYTDASRQLIARKGLVLTTITVSKPIQGSDISSKEAAIALLGN